MTKEEIEKLAEEVAWEEIRPGDAWDELREVIKRVWLAGYEAGRPRWISFKERLPEADQDVLVLLSSNKIKFAKISGSKKRWEYYGTEYFYGHDCVKYWMPLPEPMRKH